MAYGFVGTGEITAAIVTGLSDGVADPPSVFLSPRGRAVGRGLADRFPNVRVCSDNAEVVEQATTVVLAVRPPIGREVLSELSFRPEQVLISALAGVSLATLRRWAPTAGELARSIPLPQAAQRASLTAIHPDHRIARELFGAVGQVVVADSEPALDAMSAATATFAAQLDALATIADWLAGQGLAPDASAGYLKHLFGALGQTLLHSTDTLATLTTKHMTPGGINEQVLHDLRDAGHGEQLRHALDRVLTRLQGPPPGDHE
ncbi:NAD(P)-binding domain-containing protein [Microlunatus speluncae]|uniref:NAD(P)-binding domain-containing protein n=1 Tax=Microlunatus speluncae TaxID=2594267 RepID=UPI001266769A|nr:NAD(P)-binding domain-containing protein [Microlunatus speluncae]